MTSKVVMTLAVLVGIVVVIGCISYSDPTPPQSSCGADDPRVGRTTSWSATFPHKITGDLRIVDNCTLMLEHFYYDGIAIDARVVATKGTEDCAQGHILSPQTLVRAGGYTNETITIPLPEGVTLDDVERVGICCVPIGLMFAEGELK